MTVQKSGTQSEITDASVAETQGRAAFADKKCLDSNPFSWLSHGDRRMDWARGWFAARDQIVRQRAAQSQITGNERPGQVPDLPWWHGTNYEVLEPIVGLCQDEWLQAAFTPNNGIRISIWNDDMDSIASFDLSEEQAKFIGGKLIAWAERGHG